MARLCDIISLESGPMLVVPSVSSGESGWPRPIRPTLSAISPRSGASPAGGNGAEKPGAPANGNLGQPAIIPPGRQGGARFLRLRRTLSEWPRRVPLRGRTAWRDLQGLRRLPMGADLSPDPSGSMPRMPRRAQIRARAARHASRRAVRGRCYGHGPWAGARTRRGQFSENVVAVIPIVAILLFQIAQTSQYCQGLRFGVRSCRSIHPSADKPRPMPPALAAAAG